MARPTSFPKGTKEAVKQLIKKESSVLAFRKMQVVLLGCQGALAKDVAAVTFYKEGYVREIWMQYRRKGESIFESQQGKNQGRANLSSEEEKGFLAPFLEIAKQAGILIVSDVHTALQKRLGKKVVLQTTYNLLHRHGWRKIVPRSYHPKRDSEKREKWKASFFPKHKKSTKRSKKEKS